MESGFRAVPYWGSGVEVASGRLGEMHILVKVVGGGVELVSRKLIRSSYSLTSSPT